MITLALAIAGCSSTTEPPSEPVSDDSAIETLWVDFVTTAAGRSDPQVLAPFATADVIRDADTAFFEPRLPQTFWPQIVVDGDTATIEDCSLFSFPLVDSPYIPMSATATRTSAWRITSLEVRSGQPCLPGDLATEILTRYERFWDNELVFSNPPDSNHLLIEQTLTGRRLQRKRAVLEWQLENNAGLRGRPTTDPQIVAFDRGLVIIADCQVTDPETGFYDLSTDERRPETPVPVAGQTDLVRTWLELDDDTWKVEFSAVESNANCDRNTITDGIAIIGPIDQP